MSNINVILFGESGGGKSSIINLLSGGESVAETSCGERRCTTYSRPFKVDIHGVSVTLWDTAGLDDTYDMSKSDAIAQLDGLVRSLPDGVNLFMLVTRGPRMQPSIPDNWKLVDEVICRKNVPIVIVITCLEIEENMDQWWWDNKGRLQAFGINPCGVACVTATRGKRRKSGFFTFDEEYEESREKIKRLIMSTYLTVPWRVPAASYTEVVGSDACCMM